MEIIKSYKGFDKDMKCRDFQYEEWKEYEIPEHSVKVCKKGFHACEQPIDVLNYYPPCNSVYHQVEQSGEIDRANDNSKVASSRIKIGSRLSIRGLVEAQIEYVKNHTTTENTDSKQATAGDSGAATAGNYGAATAGYKGAATAGDSGAATAGDSGAATAGYKGAATAGDSGAATAGDSGAATAGESGAATAGNYGAATAGNYGAATAGNYGAATAGYKGAATGRGSAAVGENGIASARATSPKAKGGIGAVLVLVKENDEDYDIAFWKAIRIDGKRYKADIWYTLDDKGKVVAAK